MTRFGDEIFVNQAQEYGCTADIVCKCMSDNVSLSFESPICTELK